MAGKHKSFTEEIAQLVVNTATDVVAQARDSGSGLIIGEDHRNNEFHTMLADNVLPALSDALPEMPKTLFVEWDRTPETLQLLDKFMQTGDSAARDTLVETNINFAPYNDEAEVFVRRDYAKLLDSARENGFDIQVFDKEAVSIDAFLKEAAAEQGKEIEELSSSDFEAAGEKRVTVSNPVMADNIRDMTPEGASFSIVISGDDHVNKAADLNEMLGFEYLRFTRLEGEAPSVKADEKGAKYDIGLVEYEQNSDFVTSEMGNIGIQILPVFINGNLHEPWGSEENRAYMDGVYDQMQQFANLTAAGQYEEAQEQLSTVKEAIQDRWTPEQIAGDSYLNYLVTISDSAAGVLGQELEAMKTLEEKPEVQEEVIDGENRETEIRDDVPTEGNSNIAGITM